MHGRFCVGVDPHVVENPIAVAAAAALNQPLRPERRPDLVRRRVAEPAAVAAGVLVEDLAELVGGEAVPACAPDRGQSLALPVGERAFVGGAGIEQTNSHAATQ